jgi:hypothetical protein
MPAMTTGHHHHASDQFLCVTRQVHDRALNLRSLRGTRYLDNVFALTFPLPPPLIFLHRMPILENH